MKYNLTMKKLKLLTFTTLCLSLLATPQAYAGFDYLGYLDGGYKDKLRDNDQGPGAHIIGELEKLVGRSYMYEDATNRSLSHLLWAVNFYHYEDTWAIDEFMKINECSIYKNFASNDLEWEKIRTATKEFLKKNRSEFPTRFKFMLPLRIGEYDQAKSIFNLQEDYKIQALRRFEVYTTDYSAFPCIQTERVKNGYPRAMILEFSRPFSITSIPISRAGAAEYIKGKREKYKSYLSSSKVTKEGADSTRTAFLVMKVKIYTHGKQIVDPSASMKAVQMMGVLEGYEVYADQKQTELMYSETYITNKSNNKLGQKLEEQYKTLKEWSKGKGTLHY